MAVKFIKVAPVARAIPPIPTLVSTPVALKSSKFDTVPTFKDRADLVARVALGETFIVGIPVSTVNSMVAGLIDQYGRDGVVAEIVEQEIVQVL
jgi:hypothetical protein